MFPAAREVVEQDLALCRRHAVADPLCDVNQAYLEHADKQLHDVAASKLGGSPRCEWARSNAVLVPHQPDSHRSCVSLHLLVMLMALAILAPLQELLQDPGQALRHVPVRPEKGQCQKAIELVRIDGARTRMLLARPRRPKRELICVPSGPQRRLKPAELHDGECYTAPALLIHMELRGGDLFQGLSVVQAVAVVVASLEEPLSPERFVQ